MRRKYAFTDDDLEEWLSYMILNERAAAAYLIETDTEWMAERRRRKVVPRTSLMQRYGVRSDPWFTR